MTHDTSGYIDMLKWGVAVTFVYPSARVILSEGCQISSGSSLLLGYVGQDDLHTNPSRAAP